MPFHRVLVLQSVDDEITFRRRLHIEQDPLLEPCDFQYCFAIELTERQKRIPVEDMMREIYLQPFDERGLEDRMSTLVLSFSPDLVVLYYGAILEWFSDPLMATLKRIRKRFPELHFGIHSRYPIREIPGAEHVFEDTPEIRAFSSQMFGSLD